MDVPHSMLLQFEFTTEPRERECDYLNYLVVKYTLSANLVLSFSVSRQIVHSKVSISFEPSVNVNTWKENKRDMQI